MKTLTDEKLTIVGAAGILFSFITCMPFSVRPMK